MAFNDLPAEICQEIFLLCIQDLHLNWCPAIEKRERFPLFSHPTFFTSVCKDWATIARSFPPLWSFITVFVVINQVGHGAGGHINRRPSVEFLPTLPVVRKSIELSSTSPLSFCVLPWHDIETTEQNKLYKGTIKPALEEIIMPHYLRWRRVTLEWCPLESFPFSLHAVPNFPCLEHLALSNSLYFTGSPCTNFATETIHLLSNSPRLHSVEIDFQVANGKRFEMRKQEGTRAHIMASIPFARLTKLSLLMGPLNVTATLKLLIEQCSNLEILEVSMSRMGKVSRAIEDQPILCHKHLQELVFTLGHGYPSCTALLNQLILPNLRSIQLPPVASLDDSQEDVRNALIESFKKLVQRSGCRLRRLCYKSDPRAQHDTESTLQMLWSVSSSLEELEIEADTVDSLAVALSVPTSTGSSDVLCPRLRSITFKIKYAFTTSVVDLVRSRRAPLPDLGIWKLQKFEIFVMLDDSLLGPKPGRYGDRRIPQALREATEALRLLSLSDRATKPTTKNPWPQVVRVEWTAHTHGSERRNQYTYHKLPVQLDMVRLYPW
ncbi:hypothetical protein DFP72DRAFT_1059268 [Ephemerocybe angulata]|uniref:F-box domain-containing protein n=1 Tax=Ephemerocybe angulata TaxID=980116 RepID=A0A8H6MDA2_9AGAR|nr:hypothetical protein DFP72DRAFT_1059268 [Tulosesus angulatus]